MTNETEIYWCRKCEAEIMTANPTCSQCRIRMKTSSTVESLGKLIIFIGSFRALVGGLRVLIGIAMRSLINKLTYL